MRQPLSLGEIGMQTVEKCKKQRTKPEGQVICLSKGALFLCFTCYAAPVTNRWFPNRPVCIFDAASEYYTPYSQDTIPL